MLVNEVPAQSVFIALWQARDLRGTPSQGGSRCGKRVGLYLDPVSVIIE